MPYALYEIKLKRRKGGDRASVVGFSVGREDYDVVYAIGSDGWGEDELERVGGRKVMEMKEIAKVEVDCGNDLPFVLDRLLEQAGASGKAKLELFVL